MATLLYQGHGSLRLTTDSGKVIYIDPFAGEGYDEPADLILVTHQNHDHNCTDLPAKNPGCVIWLLRQSKRYKRIIIITKNRNASATS